MYNETENGAAQYETSGTACLDLFSRIGGMREYPVESLIAEWLRAYGEDSELATRIVFWVRAARKGAGERKVFHTILAEMAKVEPLFVAENAEIIAELGYFKDLIPYFYIEGVLGYYKAAVEDKHRLACKWAPRKGADASALKEALGMTWKQYRVWLKDNSETVEQAMAAKQFSEIAYSSVPGSAMRKYMKSFYKRDGERFQGWKEDKTAKASVSASYPHDIYNIIGADAALAEKQWENLPNYLEGSTERIIPMVDVSYSMQTNDKPVPMDVSIALGLYLAERSEGQFKNAMITFDSEPELVRVSDDLSLAAKFRKIKGMKWGGSTDFAKAYGLILDTAITFGLSQAQMPTMLLCLSDMQFDSSYRGGYGGRVDEKPHFEDIKASFAAAGYEAPKLVFWNLRSSASTGSPARATDDNVAMISGYSPVLMKAILSGVDFTPLAVMMEALDGIVIETNSLPILEVVEPELDGSGYDADGNNHYQPNKPHEIAYQAHKSGIQ